MSNRSIFAILLCAGFALSPLARAQSFDDRLEAALMHWRAASWYARTGNSGIAGLELDSFRESWALIFAPAGREIAWGDIARRIAALAEGGARALETDDAAAGAAALAGIGDALAEWRRHNGVVGFSDHVRRYRDAIDRVAALAPDERGDPAPRATLRASMPALTKAVDALAQHQPARWQGQEEFENLMRQNRDGVAQLAAALEGPDVGMLEIVGLIRVVRSNYWLLFLRYGAVPASDSASRTS